VHFLVPGVGIGTNHASDQLNYTSAVASALSRGNRTDGGENLCSYEVTESEKRFYGVPQITGNFVVPWVDVEGARFPESSQYTTDSIMSMWDSALNIIAFICTACSDNNCMTCTGPGTGFCTKCNAGFALNNQPRHAQVSIYMPISACLNCF